MEAHAKKAWYLNVGRLGSANFLSAFGGGLILSKATSDVVLPLLIGAAIGMLLLIRVKELVRCPSPAWFALGTAAMSAVLLAGGPRFAPVLIFSTLTIRWALWYASRSLRAERAASFGSRQEKKQTVALVDMFYFAGLIAGLLTLRTFALGSLLALDVAMQIVAASIDALERLAPKLTGSQQPTSGTSLEGRLTPAPQSFQRATIRLIGIITAATAGIQGTLMALVIFRKSPAYLAAFYVGAALSTLLCVLLDAGLDVPASEEGKPDFYGRLSIVQPLRASFHLCWLVIASGVAVIATLVFDQPALRGPIPFAAPCMLALGSTLLGLVNFPAFTRIGILGKQAECHGSVAMGFGIMAFGLAVAIFVLERLNSLGLPDYIAIPVVALAGCFLTAALTLRKPSIALVPAERA